MKEFYMLDEIRYTYRLLGIYGTDPYHHYDIRTLEGKDNTIRVKSEMLSRYDFSNKTVADVGCNSGYYSLVAAKLGASYVKAFEYNPKFRELARIQSRIHKLPVVPSAEDFLKVDEKFNVVIAFAIIHHLTHQKVSRPFDPDALRSVIASIAYRTTEVAFLEYAGDYQDDYWAWGTSWNEDVFREACESSFRKITLLGTSIPYKNRLVFLGEV